MTDSAWVGVGMTAIIQVVGYAFIYGVLTQKVRGHENTLMRHDNELDDHGKQIRKHGVKIARLEGKHGISSDDRDD